MEPIAWLDVLAGTQRGLVRRRQLLDHGISAATISRWLASGRLVMVQPGVYRLAGAPVTWEQRLLAGVLTAGNGAVASHRSAARLWDVLDTDVLEITVPADRRVRVAGVTVHRSGDVSGARVVPRHGIPTTTPLRLFVDLGAVVPAGVLEDALDRALGRQLVSVEGVMAALSAVGRHGRTGAGVLRRLLDERALGTDRPDSLLEPRMARLLRSHGLPDAAFQHELRRGGRFVARVDFAYPELRLAIEVDGFEKHSSPRALQDDLRRQNALVSLGWTVLRFTWADVVRRPARVAAEISSVLRSLQLA
ncbi:MAG: type IV toxin-antitoxin system AbiEi family antitoxin domain-containing protein [Acidimicrobiales bacterium]